jgi:DNA-binding LacI/PurR family transcriptional regulator
MKNPTRDDVARHAKVSGATVSRVLSGRLDSISDDTRQRVLEAAQHLSYRANHSARALATGQTNLVALWINHLNTPFHSQIAHIIGFERKPSQYRVLITELEALDAPHAEEAHSEFVDGLIVHEGPERVRAFQEVYPASRLPVVTIGAAFLETTDYVGVDLFGGQIEAVKHLYAIGCRRIAYLVNEDASRLADARSNGYVTIMQELGLPAEYIRTPVLDQSRATARQAVRDYVERQGHPDAVICLNDDMAIGANRALRDLGIRVPDDVCLVGCDGIEETIYQVPTITTIVQPLQEMCALAWTYLQARLEDPSIPLQQTTLTSRLVIRESTRRG